MDLKSLIDSARIDWKTVRVEPDGGPLNSDCPFANTPQDFITFAKADVFAGGVRGLINGLSNAKRAIDCQAETFIACLGLTPENLSKQLGVVGLAELNHAKQSTNDSPLKFRLLAELGVATPAIITRMRRLRNDLEHEYKRPRRRDVYDAIDVAELFIQACDGRLRSAWQYVSIESGTTNARGIGEVEPEIGVSLSYESKPSGRFEVRMVDFRRFQENKTFEAKECLLKPGQKGFVAALRLLWRSDINRDMSTELIHFLDVVGVAYQRGLIKRTNR